MVQVLSRFSSGSGEGGQGAMVIKKMATDGSHIDFMFLAPPPPYPAAGSTTEVVAKVAVLHSDIKECRSIVRDESSVYFNVTAKHV